MTTEKCPLMNDSDFLLRMAEEAVASISDRYNHKNSMDDIIRDPEDFHAVLDDIAGQPRMAWPATPQERPKAALMPLKGCYCIIAGAIWPVKGGTKVSCCTF